MSITIKSQKKSILRDTKGAHMLEYLLVAGLIAIAGIAIWTTFGEQVDDAVNEATTDFHDAATSRR